MGKVAFLRIRNGSSRDVNVKLENLRNVELNISTDNGSLGVLAAGSSFPETSDYQLGGGSGNPLFYHRIEGEPTRRIHKDGYFFVVAAPVDAADKNEESTSVRLAVDHSKWWSDRNEAHAHHREDGHECKAEGVVIYVDVNAPDDDDDDNEGENPNFKDAYVITVYIYDAIPTADWMAELKGVLASKPLCQVALPGTHDSGTYKWDKELGASPDNDLTSTIQDKLEFGRGIIRKIGSKMTDGILQLIYERLCRCQNMTTLQQLQAGIRYLDLRVAATPDGQSFYTCHGVYCVAMTEVLQEIRDFLQAHPQEIVLLDFNHFYGMQAEHHEAFAKLLMDTLGDKIATQPCLTPSSTVQEYWDAQVQAVVIYHDVPTHQASDGKLWHKHTIHSPWPNKNKTKELRENLETNVKARNKNRFFVLQGILTPDGELIKEEIMESKGSTSIQSIASRVSGKVVNWVGDEWKEENHNVVIVDFFEDCSMVPAIINLNK